MNAYTDYLSAARKSLKTTAARGERLFQDGYSIEPYAERPGVYAVLRSAEDVRPLRKGETLWNDVDVCNQDCTCECFRWRGTCKHLVAVNRAVAQAARLLGPMLPVTRQERVWPPVDKAERTAFPVPGSAAWEKQVTADFS